MKLTKASRSLVGKHLRVLKAFGKFENGDIVTVGGVWRNGVQVSRRNRFGSDDYSVGYIDVRRFELAEGPVRLPSGETWLRGACRQGSGSERKVTSMKREGTFCDFEVTVIDEERDNTRKKVPCPHVAVGACASCGKDVCAGHGSATGVIVSVRYDAGGGGQPEMVNGALCVCEGCLELVKKNQPPLRTHLLPGLLAQIQEGIRVTLAVGAIKK